MEKIALWKCSVCGYIYDYTKGDPFGAAPGTFFENLPEDWTCPICGVRKNKYKPAPPDATYRRRRTKGTSKRFNGSTENTA